MPLDLTSPSVAGPFYFAWVDPSETTFDPLIHAREDERIFGFTVEQSEGDFATLTIEIRNPRIGLLAAGRKRHCFLSYAGQAASPADVRPLFRGRLIGIPDNINGEVVTLTFSARPDDFAARKEVIAYGMKELPYYDPVWITQDAQANPDTVLEAYSALWHIDRVTGDVTTSDILVGEDGLAIFTGDDVPYDSVQVHLNETPVRRVEVIANVGWTQADAGSFTIMYRNQFDSFLADSVAKDWPTAGASLGGGWTITSASAATSIDNIPSDAFSTSITLNAPPAPIPEDQTVIEPPPAPPHNKAGLPIPPDWIFILTHEEVHGHSSATEASLQVQEQGVIIPFVSIWLSLAVRYDAKRSRGEQVTFVLEADTQSIITDPDDDDKLTLTFSANDLGQDIGTGEIPIGDAKRSTYFPTARGQLSLEYLILVARNHLLLRARAVEVTFDCEFDRAIDLSCRMNAQVQDTRLPGGIGTGKIIKYAFSCDGDSGEVKGTVTIGCAIGYGGSVAPAPGEPTYVSAGYVETGYQFYTNQINVLPAGDIGYTVPGGSANDDGLVFPLRAPPWLSQPHFYDVELSAADFPIVVALYDSEATSAAEQAISDILKTKRCHLDFTLRSVAGDKFANAYSIVTSRLVVPAQINLESESA
jgi:hypothetical protein